MLCALCHLLEEVSRQDAAGAAGIAADDASEFKRRITKLQTLNPKPCRCDMASRVEEYGVEV